MHPPFQVIFSYFVILLYFCDYYLYFNFVKCGKNYTNNLQTRVY